MNVPELVVRTSYSSKIIAFMDLSYALTSNFNFERNSGAVLVQLPSFNSNLALTGDDVDSKM